MNFHTDFSSLAPEEIYPRLSAAAKMASIDRPVEWGEVVIAPIYGAFAKEGAEKILATLAFPESLKKRLQMMNALQAAQIKDLTPAHSDARRQHRASGCADLLDTPNKRINQTLKKAVERINKRNRAAWVMWQKAASSPEPNNQDSMNTIILRTAIQNSRHQKQYGGWGGDNEVENTTRAFDRGILVPSRRVIHLAMSFYAYFELIQNNRSINLKELTLNPSEWLQPVIIAAELYRLSFGDLFPRHETNHESSRKNNFRASMQETISILPYIDKITDSKSYSEYRKFCIGHSSF